MVFQDAEETEAEPKKFKKVTIYYREIVRPQNRIIFGVLLFPIFQPNKAGCVLLLSLISFHVVLLDMS